jgi:two-component system nitrate/nitrite response regulator NarL
MLHIGGEEHVEYGACMLCSDKIAGEILVLGIALDDFKAGRGLQDRLTWDEPRCETDVDVVGPEHPPLPDAPADEAEGILWQESWGVRHGHHQYIAPEMDPTPRQTRVLIVGEDPLARGGLGILLSGEPGIEIVGQVSPGEAAGTLESLFPQVVIWDLGVNPRGVEGIAQGAEVLALVPDAELASDALRAGARGILLRDIGVRRLAAAVQAVAAGLIVLESTFDLLRQPSASPELAEPLTPREVEVLQLLAEGLSNRMVGERLGISEHTAKFHVNAILGKLGAQGRTDAVMRAARLGLILL